MFRKIADQLELFFDKILCELHLRSIEFGAEGRQIISSFFIVGFYVLIGKAAGAMKEVAIAWRYGISTEVDAYVFIFNIVTLPAAIWLTVLSFAFIPLSAKARKESILELKNFKSELMGFTMICGLLIGILVWCCLYIIFHLNDFRSSSHDGISLYLINWMVILVPLGMMSSLLSIFMMDEGGHKNTLFESIPAISILMAVIVSIGIEFNPLLLGTVIGFLLHFIILAAVRNATGHSSTFMISRLSPVWPAFWASIGVLAIGQVLSNITVIVDQVVSLFLGEGVLSALNYATRVTALVLGIGATAIGRAILPVLSNLQLNNDDMARRLTVKLLFLVLILGVLVLMFFWCFSGIIISLIFERGAFSSADSAYVSKIFDYSLIQVPFFYSSVVLASLLAAQRRFYVLAVGGGINLLCKVIFALILVPLYGVEGLILSTALMYLGLNIYYLWNSRLFPVSESRS